MASTRSIKIPLSSLFRATMRTQTDTSNTYNFLCFLSECKDDISPVYPGHDAATWCPTWKDQGYCKISATWMNEYCPKTCGFCGNSESGSDDSPVCKDKWSAKKCKKQVKKCNKANVKKNCPKTCNNCNEAPTADDGCKDKWNAKKCKKMSKKCKKSKKVKKMCQKTCNIC